MAQRQSQSEAQQYQRQQNQKAAFTAQILCERKYFYLVNVIYYLCLFEHLSSREAYALPARLYGSTLPQTLQNSIQAQRSAEVSSTRANET